MARINQAMQDLLRYNAAILPQKRSSFNKSHSHTTTMDSAYLVPLMWDRVVPGDEKKIRYSGLARMATPFHPVMDEAKLDVWAFYIPDRLWWNHAKEFYGENLDASFNPDGLYEMPSLRPDQYLVDTASDKNNIGTGSLNDYFGFPIWNGGRSVLDDINADMRCTAGLHRSYQLIWNEWFRNSSVQPALRLNQGDNVTDDEWSEIKQIRKVCKYPDYFTSLLREPQAGDDVMLPLGDWAPVVTRNVTNDSSNFTDPLKLARIVSNKFDLFNNDPGTEEMVGAGIVNGRLYANTELDTHVLSYSPGYERGYLYPVNLWADLTNATAATINNLRAAITIQHLLEIDALGGKRYQNIIQAHFGVLTPDATLQRPELLGATRTSIGMRQVLQTSATIPGESPQGNTAAFSLTNVTNEWICNKAFTEPGFIMVLGAIRPVQSYSQGVDPLLRKLNRYDHYWTVFDNLGNQPVDITAIFFTDSAVASGDVIEYSNDVFGYQEAWTEYRMKQNRVSGLMRPDHPTSLATWNYSTLFTAPPVLNSDFVEEDENLIDRTIAVPDEPQFIIDSYFDYIDVKNMSVHSIPGLLRL